MGSNQLLRDKHVGRGVEDKPGPRTILIGRSEYNETCVL